MSPFSDLELPRLDLISLLLPAPTFGGVASKVGAGDGIGLESSRNATA